jgi:hypothetical protein
MTAIFVRHYLEQIDVQEGLMNFYSKWREESLKIAEGAPPFRNQFIKGVIENLQFQENFTRPVSYHIGFEELFYVVEGTSRKYQISITEGFSMLEDWIRNSNLIISDIEFSTNELDIDTFLEKIDSPTGYTSFRDFISGDYTYQEALIRILLSADVTADRPYISNWEYNVDVPDVSDRGSVNLTPTNQPMTVQFSRSFYIIPEVTAVLKAVTAVDDITSLDLAVFNITKTSFQVMLKKGTDYATGTISWTALGY